MPSAHSEQVPAQAPFVSVLYGTMPDGSQGSFARCGVAGCQVGVTEYGDVVPWYSSTHRSHEYAELLGERHLQEQHGA